MRPLLKFLHSIGGIGLLGALASLLAMQLLGPEPSELAAYAANRAAMAAVTNWVLFPALGATLVAGLVSLALTDAFHNAGWAWVKAATGVLLFESGFVGLLGPIQAESERSAKALAGLADAAVLGTRLGPERNTMLILIALCVANVALGIWRPRFGKSGNG